MTTLEFQGLTKRFGEVLAVDDLTVHVPAGQVTGFLGPNGAGKSTALRLALGLLRPTAGRVLVAGAPYARLPRPRQVVGAVLDGEGFHPGRSGHDHLRIQARLVGVPRSRTEEVLEEVELTAHAARRVGGYSLGMRRRLGLAAALLGDPQVLVLDEPANGLDPSGVAWLRGLLKARAARGRTVLVSSHQLSEMARTVDRVVILQEGRLRWAGAVERLTEQGEDLEDAFLRLTSDPPPEGERVGEKNRTGGNRG
ncbi:MAG: type transport system ATP-binding protein [Actinomycetota bacterium]|nr:type transport system ATP-binding protein [Actinomycetota bacterium]